MSQMLERTNTNFNDWQELRRELRSRHLYKGGEILQYKHKIDGWCGGDKNLKGASLHSIFIFFSMI
jgi:hypothetical protein